MIGKISMGAGAAGAISYCYYDQKATNETGEKVVRGELLYSNELWVAKFPNGHLHISSIGAQFQQIATLNANTQKFLWHQTFNFPPGEKVSNEMMVKITRDFARNFGFENNQYLVFRHRDKPHEHFHIIANRINANGMNTATDKDNYERIQLFCRQMEKKYGLRITENINKQSNNHSNRKNTQAEAIRKIIDAQIPYCRTLSELSIALKKKGVMVHLGRGISFTNRKYGLTFKGSDLGPDYSRKQIEKRLGKIETAPTHQVNKEFGGNKRQAFIENISTTNTISTTRIIAGPNNANETSKDLAKISQSFKSVDPKKKLKRKVK